MNRRSILLIKKIFFALLGMSAIVTEMVVLVDRGTFNAANFFSFFTIESNIMAVLSLLLGAYVLAGRGYDRWIEYFRGAVTVYMATTGIVFAVLLSGLDPSKLTAVPWDNIVLHYILPIVIVVDWFLDPPRKKLIFSKALIALVFPLAFVTYSMIRGAVISWYPYPFLDPASGGYTKVLIASIGIALLNIALVLMVTRTPKKQSK